MRLTGRLVAPTGASQPLDVAGPAVRLGRDPGNEVAVPAAAYPTVSGLHARIEPDPAGGFRLVHRSTSNKTLLNGTPVADAAPVRAGDAVRLGFTGPTVEVFGLEADPDPAADRTVQAGAEHLALLRGTARAERLVVGAGGVIGRERGRVQFLLDHPHVSGCTPAWASGAGRRCWPTWARPTARSSTAGG
jgi:pSer/pThr/pTyr-binding forkhead associated (FHA) protein